LALGISGFTNHLFWDYIPTYWGYSYDTNKQSLQLQDYNELGPDSADILMEAVQECQGKLCTSMDSFDGDFRLRTHDLQHFFEVLVTCFFP